MATSCAQRKPLIHPGLLTQRITLQERAVTVDDLGQQLAGWTTLRDVWAQVITKRGREYFGSGSQQGEAQTTFRVRYASDIVMRHGSLRVVYAGVVYDIAEPAQDIDARKEAIDLVCKAGAGDDAA